MNSPGENTVARLVTIAQLAADPNYPFTEPSIRWLVFNAASNGLANVGAVVRVGRRVYIDTERFDHWVRNNNPATGMVAEAEKVTGVPKSTVHRLLHARAPITSETLEQLQANVLSAMSDIRAGDTQSALKTLTAASVALSRALVAVGERQSGGGA